MYTGVQYRLCILEYSTILYIGQHLFDVNGIRHSQKPKILRVKRHQQSPVDVEVADSWRKALQAAPSHEQDYLK